MLARKSVSLNWYLGHGYLATRTSLNNHPNHSKTKGSQARLDQTKQKSNIKIYYILTVRLRTKKKDAMIATMNFLN
jgi:hypothetical protein